VDVLGDDQAEDGVTQELQSLVRAASVVLGAPGTMRQRLDEEVVVDLDTDPLRQLMMSDLRAQDEDPEPSRATT
jgi:hypothetical protein